MEHDVEISGREAPQISGAATFTRMLMARSRPAISLASSRL
jgi:hypothetical protein